MEAVSDHPFAYMPSLHFYILLENCLFNCDETWSGHLLAQAMESYCRFLTLFSCKYSGYVHVTVNVLNVFWLPRSTVHKSLQKTPITSYCLLYGKWEATFIRVAETFGERKQTGLPTQPK